MVAKANIVLVANKIDLDREVTTEEGEELASTLGLQYCETSVKDNIDVVKAFDLLLDSMLEGVEVENGVEEKGPNKSPEETENGEKPPAEEKEEENGVEEKLEESTATEEVMVEKPAEETKEKPKDPIKLEKECKRHDHGRGCFC